MDPRLQEALAKLTRHRPKAEDDLNDAVRAAGLPVKESYTPQELYRIASALIAKGGLIEMVGRTLKVQALTAGAEAPPEDIAAARDRLNRR